MFSVRLFTAAVVLLAEVTGHAQSMVYEGTQQSGSLYRIAVPPNAQYNRVLVIYAHGFQDATDPVRIPEEQLQFGSTYLPDLVTSLGFGFATNSYSKTGLAVVQGVEDILDLVTIYEQTVGKPDKIYLAGVSEGGLISTLLLEQHPDIFAGAVSACGPIGDLRAELNYFGDARATFEYYFPGLIPGDPLHPSAELMQTWSLPGGFFDTVVQPELTAPENAEMLAEWARVAHLPFDPEDRDATLLNSAKGVLGYVVINLNDGAETLGGFPFDNTFTWYTGARDPWALNQAVGRYRADPEALEEIRRHYNTSGKLLRPLITMHTLLDPSVPYWHETIYTWKSFREDHRFNLPVNRYGHCNFEAVEVLSMFALLLSYNNDLHLLLAALDTKANDGTVRLKIPGKGDGVDTMTLHAPGSTMIEDTFRRLQKERAPRRRAPRLVFPGNR